jgi:cold shock CspA family protein
MESGSFEHLETGDTLSFYTINTERGESAENIRLERESEYR